MADRFVYPQQDLYPTLTGTAGVWTSGDTYANRISSLLTDTLLPWDTIYDDGEVDRLLGGSQLDWFFYTFFHDVVTDAAGGEILSDAGP